MPAWRRDPISEMFDAGARALLARAYANPRTWQSTRLRNPSPQHLAHLRSLGINPMAGDDKSGEGSLNARTRWARGFVRALYYQHRWYSGDPGTGGWRRVRRAAPRSAGGIEVQVGRALQGGRQAGTVLGPGRAVRVKYHPSGTQAAVRASTAPAYTIDPGAQSDVRRRDWAAE